jgi:Fe-S cluster assembly ATPase SufC
VLQRPPILCGVLLKSLLADIRARGNQKEAAYKALLEEADVTRFLERGVKDGLSGEEIPQEALIQLCLMQPELRAIDEPGFWDRPRIA